MNMATLQEYFARFNALHPKKIDLSLGRMQALLQKLDHPEKRLPPIIHVAGTNGKGSTVAFLRAMLEAAGKRVHVYTSPHLVRFNERIRLAGTLVSDDQLVEAFDACETANAGAPTTVFEMTTAAAFWLFAKVPADILLLEVGLGGRLDATNVIEAPLASVITPVSFDHPEFLGTDLAGIAFEKAGIIKRNCPVIVSNQSWVTTEVIESQAARLGAPILTGGQDFSNRQENGRFVFEDEHGLLDLPVPKLPGRHQFSNAATAIATLRKIDPDFPVRAIEAGLFQAEWPARLQRLSKGTLLALAPEGAELWLDGGHNADGARVLAEAMADFEEKNSRPLILICGMLTTKDSMGFLTCFAGLASGFIAVPIHHAPESARTPQDLAQMAASLGIQATTAEDVPAALERLRVQNWPQQPRILMCGSLYLAGEILDINGTLPE